jgi:hypothetical protein
MPSVRRLLANHENERFAGRFSRGRKPVVFSERAWVDSLVAGAGRRSCGLRAPRYSGRASPPNKPMHPTADTSLVMFLRWGCAAGDWQRSAAGGESKRRDVSLTPHVRSIGRKQLRVAWLAR